MVVGVDGDGVVQRPEQRGIRHRVAERHAALGREPEGRELLGDQPRLVVGREDPVRVEHDAGVRRRREARRVDGVGPEPDELGRVEVRRHRDHERPFAARTDVGEDVDDARHEARGLEHGAHLGRAEPTEEVVHRRREPTRVEATDTEPGLERVQVVERAERPGDLQAGARARQQRAVHVEHEQRRHARPRFRGSSASARRGRRSRSAGAPATGGWRSPGRGCRGRAVPPRS